MFGAILAAIIIGGFILGKLAHKYINSDRHSAFAKTISSLQMLSVFLLLAMMGYKIGSNKELIAGFGSIGLHSALFGISALAFSSIFTWLLVAGANKLHLKKRNKSLTSHADFIVENTNESQSHSFVIILLFLAFVAAGGVIGYFQLIRFDALILSNIVDGSLYALVFFIGIDMGLSQLNLAHLKSISISVVLICLGVMIGSIAGAVIVGYILGYNPLYSAAIGSPMGWYSLAGIMLAKIDEKMGAIAFTANLIRELTAIAFVPLIGKVLSKEGAIAACGATAMDTSLPSIIKGLGRQYAVTGFAAGIIISFIVPFFLSIIQIIYGIM
ncbi:MAG: lysine exporter LysO family protein [Clostridia bacterium]|nr:lysine exporter LysO family protein [Clostridia bacterium]